MFFISQGSPITSRTNAKQNAVYRFVNLPVVSSAYTHVSVFYADTKGNHPHIKSMCEVFETAVKSITSLAYDNAAPIIFKLEPQISIVNELACRCLDKLESALPVLQKPSQEIVSSAKSKMLEAKEAVAIAVSGSKDCVFYTITGLTEKTSGVVMEKLVLMASILGSGGMAVAPVRRAVRLASDSLESALSMSEMLVEQALPPTHEEMEEEVKKVKGFELVPVRTSYSVRLMSLSAKLWRRAYQQTEARMPSVRLPSLESLFLLRHSMEMDKLRGLAQWTSNVSLSQKHHETEDVFHDLVLTPGLSQKLQTGYFTLGWNLHSLPRHLQEQTVGVLLCASQIYNNFNGAATQDHPPGLASLDGLLDYLLHNTPLNWLMGPLFPRVSPPVPPCGPVKEKPTKRVSVIKKVERLTSGE